MLFNNGIAGTGVGDINVRFRMYLVFTVGIFALGSVLYWRSQVFITTDYVEFPIHKAESVKALSSNYQIEYLEDSIK